MHPDAALLVKRLELAPHPEGGFYRETWRSSCIVRAEGESSGARGAGTGMLLASERVNARAASTAIYFLLPAGTFSALHRVASDEVWHHYDGDPLDLHLIDGRGAHSVVALGRDWARGELPQHVVPAGTWQAAVPRGDRYALSGCTVAPGFDFSDFEMPPRADLLAQFPAHAALIAQLTR